MATGKATDFKIYPEQFYGGSYESISQNVDAFNAASNGVLALVTQQLKGDYEKESFLKELVGMITRRDTTSVAAATDQAMTQDEYISVKINRKIGPIAQTIDAWRKIGSSEQEMSFKLGQMMGEKKFVDFVNTAIAAGEAALQNVAGVNKTFAATIDHGKMVDALALRGDLAGAITAWIMHSKPYFDLVKQSIADKIFGVANISVFEGTAATLGRRVIVIDAPALVDAGAPSTYNTLGLVPGAVTVKESEDQHIVSQVVTGLENLVMRVQGEYAFNIGVKGYKWDTTAGGVGPTDAAVATATNWLQAATNIKQLAGVRLVTQ